MSDDPGILTDDQLDKEMEHLETTLRGKIPATGQTTDNVTLRDINRLKKLRQEKSKRNSTPPSEPPSDIPSTPTP